MRSSVRSWLIVGVLGGSLLGCGDDPVAPNSSCMTVGPVVNILDNHLPSGGDHKLTVPAADVVAAIEKVYDIRGDNVGHTHTVTLTTANFTSLQSGVPVTVASSNNGPVGIGHDHTVEFSCP